MICLPYRRVTPTNSTCTCSDTDLTISYANSTDYIEVNITYASDKIDNHLKLKSRKQLLELIKKSKREYVPDLDYIKLLYKEKCEKLNTLPIYDKKMPKPIYKRIKPYIRNALPQKCEQLQNV
jgi:hypothetical protein